MQRPRFQLAITGGLIFIFLLAAGWGLGDNDSYWSDELWSVSASRAEWGVMLRDWLIPDTHPPLYQSLLKLWIGIGGSGEMATRSLSLLMAALGLLATALFASGRGAGRRLVSVAFLGSSPAFMVYAQESRSYATSLALSAVVLGVALELRQRRLGGSSNILLAGWGDGTLRGLFVLACLLLSLTHYFSLLFVLVVLAVVSAEGLVLARRRQVLPLLLGLLVWPAAHLLSSSFANKLQRLSWIRVEPIHGTITQFLEGTLPLLAPGRAGAAGLLLLSVGLAAALVLGFSGAFRGPSPGVPGPSSPARGEGRFLLLVIGVFLALMLPIDLIKPLSQPRYYIVLLPAVAYLFGHGWELTRRLGHGRRLALASLLAVWLLLQWQLGQRELAEKRAPWQNYKLMASFVERSGLCDGGCWSNGWPLDTLSPLYFRPGQLQQTPDGWPDAGEPLNRPFLGFHRAHKDRPALRAAHPDLACWEAPGAWRNTPFILLPRTSAVQPARHGLRPCP